MSGSIADEDEGCGPVPEGDVIPSGILVTGATGMLGRAVMKELADLEDVYGIGWSRADGKKIEKVDLRDRSALKAYLEDKLPEFVIHCAAHRKPDVCGKDPEETKKLNIIATKNLAELCASIGAWVLYISTDYVFDGTKPPYKPNAVPSPLNLYGKTKREGELVVMKSDKNAGILRVPILYGPVESLEECSISQVLRNVLAKKPVTLDNYHKRYPTNVGDVAFTIRKLVERKAKHCGLGGIWHLSGKACYTKFTMAQEMGKIFSLDLSHISPANSAPKDDTRPYDSKLDTIALSLMRVVRQSPFAKCVADEWKGFVLAAEKSA